MTTQADCRIGESLFYDCFYGTVINAGAAANANISIDDVGLVALRDSLNGAVIGTAAALDTSVSNLEHDFPSSYMLVAHPISDASLF